MMNILNFPHFRVLRQKSNPMLQIAPSSRSGNLYQHWCGSSAERSEMVNVKMYQRVHNL
ncbi:hypothetical protein BVRB_6g146110 [Beta vulgaris subsp. vulgaris]|nr:hypothetical protein BVRB_6g146110 [Beta vulgaris subsp. vulgaris]